MPRKKPHPETCPRCPHRYSDNGCPFYMTGKEGIMEEKITLGGPPDVRLVTGCIWHEGHFMRWISHMVAAANKPAAVLQGWRNDAIEKLGEIGQKVTFVELVKAMAPMQPGINAIELDRSRLAKEITDAEHDTEDG